MQKFFPFTVFLGVLISLTSNVAAEGVYVANFQKYPFLVMIKSKSNVDIFHGVIISKKFVLSTCSAIAYCPSLHCNSSTLNKTRLESINVIITYSNKVFNVTNTTCHPKFERKYLSFFNIAILQINGTFEYNNFTKSIKLYSHQKPINSMFLFNGSVVVNKYTYLLEFVSPIYNIDQCQEDWDFYLRKDHNSSYKPFTDQICAKTINTVEKNGMFLCKKNKGYPLIVKKKYLIGISTFAEPCVSSEKLGLLGIFTYIPQHIEWIREHVEFDDETDVEKEKYETKLLANEDFIKLLSFEVRNLKNSIENISDLIEKEGY